MINLQTIIHSGYQASIVECGHGAELANTFLSQPGASAFITNSSQPYAKEIQQYLYPLTKGMRSVSKDFVHTVCQSEMLDMYKMFKEKSEKLLSIVTSFQLDGNTGLTHGYLAIGSVTDIKSAIDYFATGEIYHLSFYRDDFHNEHSMKTTWILSIKSELLKIIDAYVYDKKFVSNHVDGAWEFNPLPYLNRSRNMPISNMTYDLLDINQTPISETSKENFLCFVPGKEGGGFEIVRFEDIVRLNKGDKKGIVIQKGSYNPFHRAHKRIGTDAVINHPDYPHVLMISMNTCDKGVNNVNVLVERITNLTNLGYIVIVSKSGLFLDNAKKIKEHYPDLNIVFPVGEDTIERFFRDWEKYFTENILHYPMRYTSYKIDFKNVTWHISKRNSDTKQFGVHYIEIYQKYLDNFQYSNLEMDDISSTAIRNGLIENIL